MKKLMLVTMICVAAAGLTAAGAKKDKEPVVRAASVPAYAVGQWYIWASNQTAVATAALNYINVDSGFFPIYETRRGVLNTNKISTLRWVSEVQTLVDGRVGFQRIPDSLLDAIGVPVDQRGLFWGTFGPSAVVVTSEMLPQPDEE